MTRTKQLLGVALIWLLAGPPRRDERGLSQSTENAILLAGAVTVATLVTTVIFVYVQGNLPK
ncbi:hypothetical protein ACF3NT_12270 [Naumannella halotolerans]|uniref:Uncharacterized protein n=1 Tax=Naumannella halotolerans TaxID=993414 RepID=A0A4R7J480_9ACTN|nr:hypothetical protein [Naumannella halotolerans]TDT31149.1 hypothetical protein CLV29_2562 [Naumannella halotolerans]